MAKEEGREYLKKDVRKWIKVDENGGRKEIKKKGSQD